MIKKILLAVLGLVVAGVAVLLALILTRPDTFRISRSAVVPAPPAVVFGQVNDLRRWEPWSPWAKLDPNSRVAFDGPPAGVGSSMSWAGNEQVGEGRMTITESRADERIRLRLDFIKPFTGTSETEFTFVPDAGGTKVTWTMSGTNGFAGKAISLVMDCDAVMGGQFEKGLENLKAAVVSPAGGVSAP